MLKWIEPRCSVATQVKTLIAEKMRDEHREHAEDAGVELAHAGDEHVVAPGEKADERDAQRRVARWRRRRRGGLREKVHTISLMTPIAGRIMM